MNKARRLQHARAVIASLVLLAALLLGSAPYLYGYAIRPPGSRFWAVPPINSGDANQYLAFTRMVAGGQMLVGDPFTSEPHAPRLFLPHVLFEALLARLFDWTPLEAFQAARVVFGAALLLAGWWFGTLFLARWRQRWIYLGLLCFSAGASWLVARSGLQVDSGDLLQPEGNTFFTLGNLPHLSLSSALLTALFGLLRALERDGKRRWLLLTFLCSLLLSWTHPFDYLALGLGLGSYGLARGIADRRIPAASLAHFGALFLGALPAALYLIGVTRSDPVYQALASDTLRVQPFLFYAIAHGLLALPALAVLSRPELRRRYALPLCWAGCAFLFLLLPLPLGGKQPRVVGGVHVPLALLASAGLDRASRWAARRAVPRGRATSRHAARLSLAACAIYVSLTATGVYGMVERHARSYAPRLSGFYISPAVQELYRWLDREGDAGQVTLGGSWTAGWAPTWTDARVYHGHWHMTLNEGRKRRERDWFFTGPPDPAARARWLRQRGITWVIWCPWEWGGQAGPLEGVPGLQRVYSSPEAVLYRLSP
jgi:hypothetical protein